MGCRPTIRWSLSTSLRINASEIQPDLPRVGLLSELRAGELKAVRCYGELKIRAAAYKLQ